MTLQSSIKLQVGDEDRGAFGGSRFGDSPKERSLDLSAFFSSLDCTFIFGREKLPTKKVGALKTGERISEMSQKLSRDGMTMGR